MSVSSTARPKAEGFEMCPLPGSEAGEECPKKCGLYPQATA